MKKNEESAKGVKITFTSLLIFCITGITIMLLLSLIGTALVISETLPHDFILHFCAVSVFVGSFLASILSCKKLGKPLLTALASTILFLLILFIAGAVLFGRILPGTSFLAMLSAVLLGALLGAIFSAGKKRAKRSKR